MSLGKCKSTLQYGITTYPLELPKSKTLTISNDVGELEQWELSFTADGNVKWYSHFGRVWKFLIKLNLLLPYDLEILLIHLPK